MRVISHDYTERTDEVYSGYDEWYGFFGDYATTTLTIRAAPSKTIRGIEEFCAGESLHRYYDIVVTPDVAEYLAAHAAEHYGLCTNVLAADVLPADVLPSSGTVHANGFVVHSLLWDGMAINN